MIPITTLPRAQPDAAVPGRSGAAGRIARGLAANVGGMGVTLTIQLVSVPVLLAAWGVATYGEWLVLSAIPTYLALSDLSFSSVAGNSMTMLVGQGKQTEAAALGRRLWSIVTPMTAVAVLGALALAFLSRGLFGSGAAISATEAQIVLGALFLHVAVGNQYGVLDAWYRAGGHYPLGITMRQLGRLLEFGALLVAVFVGAQPGAAAVAFLGGSTAGLAISWVVLRRAVPWSSFRPERPRLQTFRDLLAPGVAYMAFPVGNAISLQGMTIVVAATLGTSTLVVFATTRTVTRAAMLATGTVSNAIWPELSRSIGGGRTAEARAILRSATQLAVAVSILFAVLLAVIGPSLIRSWTHGLVDPPRELLSILLLVVLGNSVWNTLSALIFATNQHQRMAIVFLASATLAMATAIPLSVALGLTGAAMSLVLFEIGMILYVLPAALRVVEDRPRPFLAAVTDVARSVQSVRSRLRRDT